MTDLRARASDLRRAFPSPTSRAAPVEQGQRLAAIKRGDDELRLSWVTYEGREFLSLRVWTKGGDGNLYPGKAGVTVRAHELPDVADALAEALDLAAKYAATLPARGSR